MVSIRNHLPEEVIVDKRRYAALICLFHERLKARMARNPGLCVILCRMSALKVLLVPVILAALAQSIPAGQKRENPRDYYRKWLEEDIVYIITSEEQAVFLKLSTDEERDRFIEQFWARRDPDPATAQNECQEEHYRRIHYANDRFAAGIPGWKTDRGRVYIVFGKPDQVESYPAGGSYQRKPHEGGGWTSVYPFEIWRYRHLESVGDDIELEFVNDAGGNLYRLTMDPQDKDEFLRVPGMGLTDAELFNPEFEGKKSFNRVHRIRESGLAEKQGIFFERARDLPFEKSELLMKISKPPPIRFADLREKVAARVTYNLVPVRMGYDFIRLDAQNYMVPVTLAFHPADVSFQLEAGLRLSRLQIYGLVTTITGQRVFEFDDEIVLDLPEAQAGNQETRTYQRKLPLKPGRFKLDILVKDAVSGNMGTAAVGMEIPSVPEGRLSTSSIILAQDIEPSSLGAAEPYVFGVYKVSPQVERVFARGDNIAFYVEAYDFRIDQASTRPQLEIKYGFASPGKAPTEFRPIQRGVTLDGDRVYIARILQLSSIEKGRHDLVLSVTDLLSGQTATTRVPFEIR